MKRTAPLLYGLSRFLGKVISALVTSIALLTFPMDISVAQVTPPPITSSGLNTTISAPITLPNGKLQYDITGGTRPGNGPNLFHSFGNFNVPTNNIANLFNDTGLQTSNILGRVTGGNPSTIFGTIRTTDFGNASLFLINPKGIVFGPTASLDIGATTVPGAPRGSGSFFASTADYIQLGTRNTPNAGIFSANPAVETVLTSAPVMSFGFLGPNAASIAVQGSKLQVAQGQTLSFVGGNQGFTYTDPGTGNTVSVPGGLAMTGGSLSAPSGQINLVSVASPGEVLLSHRQLASNINGESFTALGPLNLSQGATLDVSGNGTGTISIRGGQLVMNQALLTANAAGNMDGAATAISVDVQDNVVLLNRSSISTATSGTGRSGGIEIVATTVGMDASMIKSSTTGSGQGGDISLNANTVSLTNGAQIVSSTTGAGPGGDITISTTDAVSVSGFDKTGTLSGVTPFLFDPSSGLPLVTSGVFTTASGGGSGGQISIAAPTVKGENAGTLATITSGDGRGGDLVLTVGSLRLTTGAQVVSFSGIDPVTFEFRGAGAGGDITVAAGDSVHMGANASSGFFTQISSSTFNNGKGGSIQVSAPNVSLDGGAVIQSDAEGSGSGGNISIFASNQLSLAGSDVLGNVTTITSSTESGGNGGAIDINAGSVSIADRGGIRASAFDIGNAGDMRLGVHDNLDITGGGVITSSGGNIAITADRACVSGRAGSLASRIESFPNRKFTGNIAINVRELVVTAGARINSVSAGHPGTITIVASESLTVSDKAKIRMETDSGVGGTLEITAPSLTLDQGIVQTETIGPGDAGAVHLVADNLTLSGGFIDTTTRSSGRGGDVTVSAKDNFLIMGQFTGSALDQPRPAGIYTTTTTSNGDAGRVSVSGNSVTLSGGGKIDSSTLASARGGDITITGGQSVTLEQGSSISASSTGAGNAGNITINGGNQFLMQNSSVTTQAAHASGGNISVAAGDMVRLTNSRISASVFGGPSTSGGNITIDPNFVILQNSQILAQAVQGRGGNITITTNVFLPDANSIVDASSQFGVNGTVTIQSPTSNLSSTWGRLQQSFAEAAALLRTRCAAQVSDRYSSFVLAGRDSLPLEPGGWLPSPLPLERTAVTPPVAQELTVPNLALAQVRLRGFDEEISWPWVGKTPRRFHSVLDTGCGS